MEKPQVGQEGNGVGLRQGTASEYPIYFFAADNASRTRHTCLTSIFFSLEYWFQSLTSATVRPQPVQTSPPTLCEQIPRQGLESGLLGREMLMTGQSRGGCQTYYTNCHFLPAKTGQAFFPDDDQITLPGDPTLYFGKACVDGVGVFRAEVSRKRTHWLVRPVAIQDPGG
jgi:hypothetical protein